MANPRAGGVAFFGPVREIAQRKRSGMRNRKYLIGALVGVIGALAFSGTASAVPTSQTLQTTLSPAKQSPKVFGGVSLLNIIGSIQGKLLVFSNIPNTPGNVLTKFDTTFNKRKTGKKTYYVEARCKKGAWKTSETTNFYSGETLQASSTGKCKKKR